jgi:hypothetical protein
MRNTILYISLVSLLFLYRDYLFGQVIQDDSLSLEEETPSFSQYKPVVGIGGGTFNFFGDVTDNFYTPVSGRFAPKVTVSSYLDKARRINLEFFFLTGVLSGNQNKPGKTLNFRSEITDFGVGLHLTLRDFQRERWALSPYIGIGIESFRFNSKGDLQDANGSPYNYTPGGTILDSEGHLTSRDFTYETDLREADLYGYGKFPESSFSIPLDVGMDLALSERISLRFGTSFHFIFTDYTDNITSDDVGLFGNKGNDIFSNAYVSLHVDLFNMPFIMNLPKFFIEAEYDEIMQEDEDGDNVLDFFDQCPFTQFGAEVDGNGCPLDGDQDGVPDYRDQELNTPYGDFVNDEGVSLSEEEWITLLAQKDAVERENVSHYINKPAIFSRYGRGTGEAIPDKFKSFDTDEDGTISFDELLDSIDAFFDFRTFLSKEDIYELIEFFFLH